jgi:hypothetical protein
VLPVGRTHFALSAFNTFKTGRSGVNLSLTGPDAKAHFRLIEDRYKEQVDARLAPLGELEWRLMPDSKESQVLVQRNVSPAALTTWPELNVWMASTLRVMHDLSGPSSGPWTRLSTSGR